MTKKKAWRGANRSKLGGSSAPAIAKEEAGMDAQGQGNSGCLVPATGGDVKEDKGVPDSSVPTSSEGESSGLVTPVLSYKMSLQSDVKVDNLNMQNLSLQDRLQASAERFSGMT